MGKSIGVMTPGGASQTNGMALTAATAVLSINTVITSCPGWPNRIVASIQQGAERALPNVAG